MNNKPILVILSLITILISACSTKEKQVEYIVQTETVKDPGSVEYVWEPPIVDVVDVPPGLDPEGNYYRPAHQEVIEIRQGRWRYKEPVDKQIRK